MSIVNVLTGLVNDFVVITSASTCDHPVATGTLDSSVYLVNELFTRHNVLMSVLYQYRLPKVKRFLL